MKKANTNTHATTNKFETLINVFEDSLLHECYNEPSLYDVAYVDALTDLAKAITYSVLNKCIDPQRKGRKDGEVSQSGINPMLLDVKKDVYFDSHLLDKLDNVNMTAYSLQYNEDGDLIQVVTDKTSRDALNTLCMETLGDGIDLVNTTITAILSEVEKAKEHNNLTFGFMERTYDVRRLKRKVYIKLEDSVNGWETVETTPIQEIYKSVRRAVQDSRAMSLDPRNGYTYLESMTTDSETGEQVEVYKRLNKYADLGGYACDFNGATTLYSASEQVADDMDALVASLNLTVRQATVLKLRLSGYGYKAIGTYLGIRSDSVRDCMRKIQDKVKKSDSFNIKTLKRYINR